MSQPPWVRKHANKWVETALKYVASDPRSPGWHPADLINEAAKKLRPSRPIDLSQSELWCDVPALTTPEDYVTVVLAAMAADPRVSTRISSSGKKVFVSSGSSIGSTTPSSDPTSGRWVPAHAEHWAGVAARFVNQDSDARKRYYTADIINNAGRALQSSVRPASYADVPPGTTIEQYMAKITRLMPRYADIQLGEDERGRQYFVKRREVQTSAVMPALATVSSPPNRGTSAAVAGTASAATSGRWAAVAATAPTDETGNPLQSVFPSLPALAPRAPVAPTPEWVRDHAEHWTGVAQRFIDQPHNTHRRYYTQDIVHNSGAALQSRTSPAYDNVPRGLTGAQYASAVLAHIKRKGELELSQDDRGRQYLSRKKANAVVSRPVSAAVAARRPSDSPSVSSYDGSRGSTSAGLSTASPPRASPASQPTQRAAEPVLSAPDATSSTNTSSSDRIAVDTSEPAWVTAHSSQWIANILAYMMQNPGADGWPIAQLFESANKGLGPATAAPEVGSQHSTGVLQPGPRLRPPLFKDVPSHITAQQYFSTIVSRIAQHELMEVKADKDGMPQFGLRATAPGGHELHVAHDAAHETVSDPAQAEVKGADRTGPIDTANGWSSGPVKDGADAAKTNALSTSLWGPPASTATSASATGGLSVSVPSVGTTAGNTAVTSTSQEAGFQGSGGSAPAPPAAPSTERPSQDDPLDQVALSVALRGFDPASPASIFSRTPGNMGQMLRHSAASFHATGVGVPFPTSGPTAAGPGLGNLPSLAAMNMAMGAASPMANMYTNQAKAMELMLAAMSVQSPHLGLRAPGLPFSMANAMQAMQGMQGQGGLTQQPGGVPAQAHGNVLTSGAGAAAAPARGVAPAFIQALQAEALAARSLAQAQASRALTLAVHALEHSQSAEDAASARAAIDAARSALEIVAQAEAQVSPGHGPGKTAPPQQPAGTASTEVHTTVQALNADKPLASA